MEKIARPAEIQVRLRDLEPFKTAPKRASNANHAKSCKRSDDTRLGTDTSVIHVNTDAAPSSNEAEQSAKPSPPTDAANQVQRHFDRNHQLERIIGERQYPIKRACRAAADMPG